MHPQTEDADTSAVTQVILVQKAVERQRSIVLSIYDSAYDNGRPHSHAVVTSSQPSIDH